MFDTTTLISIGKDNSIGKTVSGILYMYIRKKQRINKNTLQSISIGNYEKDYSRENFWKSHLKEKNEEWKKYFCFIKANIFYVYEIKEDTRPTHVFLLEGVECRTINFYMALKQKLIEKSENLMLGKNTDILEVKLKNQDNGCKYYFYTPENGSMKRWTESLNDCSIVNLKKIVDELTEENEALKEEIGNVVKLKDLDLHTKDMEINDLKSKIRILEENLENTTTKNKRLQIAAEVNIKSTDEMLQKKISELEVINKQLDQKLEENVRLQNSIREAKDEKNKMMHLVNSLEQEKKNLTRKMNRILETYEDARSEPEKITLINYNTNERYQKLVLNNKTLKEDIVKLNDRFFKLEEEYKEKIKILKEVVEIGDVFDYLHKLILLCQTKIKYYEEGYKYDAKEERRIKTTIYNLIKEAKVSETNARVCYIRHRSKVLEERLNYYINRVPASDYFYFACTVLRRLGWIFGEIEVLNPLIGPEGEEYPFFSYKGEENVFPLREQIYFNEGLEGRARYNIVSEVDVYSFPQKMCPYKEKLLSDNNYNYIKIKLTDIKKDFNILKKKSKLQNDKMISDVQWDTIKLNAFDRLERSMLMLEERTNGL